MLEQLSTVLLDLHRASRQLDLREFPTHALTLLRRVVPFDFAWWGIVAHPESGEEAILHSSVTLDLPSAYSERWREIMSDDGARKAAAATPGITRRHLANDPRIGASLRRLLEDCHIAQVLITSHADRPLGLLTFLSLYRTSATPEIGETERIFTEVFVPHLIETRNTNWVAQLTRMHASSPPSHTAAAIADREGVLHAADPSFHKVMCTEWPQWQGARLPPELRRCIGLRTPYEGRALLARFISTSGLQLLELRLRSPVDLLSPRERMVAERFSQGLSHKEIAMELQLAPVTVRHHLRSVYGKLDVDDKAQLARVLSSHRYDQPWRADGK